MILGLCDVTKGQRTCFLRIEVTLKDTRSDQCRSDVSLKFHDAFVSVFFRPAEDLSRETKTGTDSNHNPSPTVMVPSSHTPGKASSQVVTSSSPASSSNSVLSSFLYGMPMSSKPHPDGKLDFKPMSLLNLGKDRAAGWTAGTDKSASAKDCPNSGESEF